MTAGARGLPCLRSKNVSRLDDRLQRQFTWIVSIQLTMMVTMIGVLAAAFFRTY